MKYDFETLNEIEDIEMLCGSCKQMIEDVFEMTGVTGDKSDEMFLSQKDSIFNHANIAFDYIIKINEGLSVLAEKIEKAPKPTK